MVFSICEHVVSSLSNSCNLKAMKNNQTTNQPNKQTSKDGNWNYSSMLSFNEVNFHIQWFQIGHLLWVKNCITEQQNLGIIVASLMHWKPTHASPISTYAVQGHGEAHAKKQRAQVRIRVILSCQSTCMFLDYRKKSEYPEYTCVCPGINLHTQS